jgi:hypothetical protein
VIRAAQVAFFKCLKIPHLAKAHNTNFVIVKANTNHCLHSYPTVIQSKGETPFRKNIDQQEKEI